jgi:beta-xylosidase
MYGGFHRRLWAIATIAVLGTVGLAPAAAAVTTDPAYPGDFPDPFVLRTGSSTAPTYYAYSTRNGSRYLQVITSHDLHHWSVPGNALPTLPSWAGSPSRTWAPEVLPRGSQDVMYYTVHEAASGDQCISRATAPASSPLQYVDSSTGPLVCQHDHGGSIDPSPFVAPDGTAYLLWKSADTSLGETSSLWARRLSANGRSLVRSGPTRLLTASKPWQGDVIEGPSMRYDRGTYYLFYGANNFASAKAGIGYATCRTPLGPCTDQSATGPWLSSHGNATGPSSPATFVDAHGALRFAYHAWQGGVIGYGNGGVRDLWIDSLRFVGGRPTLF